MKVAIIEDEERAANRLKQLLSELEDGMEVLIEMETVREVIAFNWKQVAIDLVFLDIHLADGISFEIFKQIDLKLPIIFTTAYDQYALEAFEVNSIDYLLKPISAEKLDRAVGKWRNRPASDVLLNAGMLDKLFQQITDKQSYMKNMLVSHKHQLVPVAIEGFALFFINNGVVKGLTFDKNQFFPEQNLDELEELLDPTCFYRASRQIILNKKSIKSIEPYFNSRLLIHTEPSIQMEILVSKAKARDFKDWIRV